MKATEKRIQILQAAKACFTQYGYDKTTLDDIGKRLGLNKSSLYYYFKNKEEIFTAVVVQETDDILVELQQEMSVHHEPEEKIQLLLETLESIRATLDETISFIDDSMIDADDRG